MWYSYYGTLIRTHTPGIQSYKFRPPGVTPNRGMAPREALFVKLLWPLVQLLLHCALQATAQQRKTDRQTDRQTNRRTSPPSGDDLIMNGNNLDLLQVMYKDSKCAFQSKLSWLQTNVRNTKVSNDVCLNVRRTLAGSRLDIYGIDTAGKSAGLSRSLNIPRRHNWLIDDGQRHHNPNVWRYGMSLEHGGRFDATGWHEVIRLRPIPPP